MSPIYNFLNEKKSILKELKLSILNNRIDHDVISILEILNANPAFYSTSSCSGRVMLLAVAHPGAKNRSEIIEKWHNQFNVSDLKGSIEKWTKHPNLYFLAQPPIFHVTSNNLKDAIFLRNLAESAGFKYSSIRSIKLKNKRKNSETSDNSVMILGKITVELLSTERLNIPMGYNNKLIVDDDYLVYITEIANDMILDSKEKLNRLKLILEKNFISIK